MKPKFLLIGSGKLAKHFRYYFFSLKLHHLTWSRVENSPEELLAKAREATHILLLISDSAISSFSHDLGHHVSDKIWVHFSGALQVPHIHGVHPLMTFGPELYPAEEYKKIPLISTSELPQGQLLPGLPNPFYKIHAEDKARYHAMSVMAGNFPQFLWDHCQKELIKMGLSAEVISPFLTRVLQNFLEHGDKAFTGPFIRKDHETVKRNLHSLDNDPYKKIYTAFQEILFPEWKP